MDEIKKLEEQISVIENDIKFYEDYLKILKKWNFFDLAGKPIEAYLKAQKSLLDFLKSKKHKLIMSKANLTHSLINRNY